SFSLVGGWTGAFQGQVTVTNTGGRPRGTVVGADAASAGDVAAAGVAVAARPVPVVVPVAAATVGVGLVAVPVVDHPALPVDAVHAVPVVAARTRGAGDREGCGRRAHQR